MKFLSTFDGCHMFGVALRNAGFDCIGTSEIEKHAAAVTRYHYPDTPQLGDIRNVRPTQPFDLLVGGFPCQDLSVAGDRRGLAGERSGLFWELCRIARECSPAWILLENVPGLLSSNEGRDMGTVVGALGQLGYGWAYRVLDAQHFGVPQRRRRVFIVGCLGDSRRAGKVLFEPESVRGDSPPSREAGAGASGDVAKCLTAHGQRLDGETETFVVNQTAFNWRGDDYAPSEVSPCLNTHGRGSIATGVVLSGRASDSPAALTGAVSSTVRASQGGQDKPHVLTFGGVRRLMPIECERLQGLPDDWTRYGRKEDGTVYEVKDGPRYAMIGNGGAVPVVEWVGRRIQNNLTP